MFKIAMTALILSMGVADEDVDTVFDKFMSRHGLEEPAEKPSELVKKMRKIVDSL